MANRQHGPGRSPSGERTVRAVPASRFPGGGPGSAGWGTGAPRAGHPEPEVRRWPHPVEGGGRAAAPEPAMHYIRCALSYQNQLLADIKVLLEQLAAEEPEDRPGEEEAD